MNATKVMPVDLAMYMCLSRHPPVRQLLVMSTLGSQRALTTCHPACDSKWPKPVKCPRNPVCPASDLINPDGTFKKKKQVVFADDKGLALTAVRIFKSNPPVPDEKELTSFVKIKTESSVQSKKPRLRLGFPQPSADLPSYLESLAKSQVHLESCTLTNGSLLGKVRVCNISPEKAVHVHITYDSWRSHQDFQCTPVQQKNGNAETEVFVFNIPFPPCPSVQDRVEFCVSFHPGSGNMILWDNNGRQNYRILVEEVYSVEKKPLRPQNSQSLQLLPLRTGPALYKSLNSLTFSETTNKTLSRQENHILKTTFHPNFNSANKLN
ncbi:protein phosphatase 1 regulatory subunit 3C-like [Neoarius graeffei]|uniref:protein phosphatase 1 regulatory subunit 3C-like n=1 Tax=Neoarius graeffei TaxID=443677 RepID=UPI00298BE610|nr:protein phosphatase 1 regulatory subunit 3C-like [Neoarius graeffei]